MEFSEPSFVEIDGRRLAYEEVSPPDPEGTVLLLPGVGAKRQGWYKQLPVLGERYRTLALDYRDTGDSDAAEKQYSIADVAGDVAGLADALGIEKAHVIGVSMGGFVAMELALARPELIDRLILVVTSAGGNVHVATSHEMMAALSPGDVEVESGEGARRVCSMVAARGWAAANPDEIEAFVEIARYRPMTRAAFIRQLKACRAHDVSWRLEQISTPTLVIHGEADPLVKVENGRLLAERIPRAELIVYPDVGHIPEVECVEKFNRDLISFLSS